LFINSVLVRKDVDENEHERLFNFTLKTKIKENEKHFLLLFTFHAKLNTPGSVSIFWAFAICVLGYMLILPLFEIFYWSLQLFRQCGIFVYHFIAKTIQTRDTLSKAQKIDTLLGVFSLAWNNNVLSSVRRIRDMEFGAKSQMKGSRMF
jgi:hypothetical protein